MRRLVQGVALGAAAATAAAAAAACASRPGPGPGDGAANAPAGAPAGTSTPPRGPAGAATGAAPTDGPVAPFTWSASPVARRVEVATEVEITDEAGGAEPERVRTVVVLTDTVAAGPGPAGSARAAGTVESYAVSATARVQGATAGAPAGTPAGAAAGVPFVPFAYRAFSDARGVRADAAPGAAADLRCTAPAGPATLGALAAAREALPRVPAGAAPGARWRDTTVSAACAGPVLLVVQTASRYEAEAGPGGALAVVRRSTTTLSGQGAAGVRPVAVSGAGSGEARYLLDPARGALAGAEAESRTALTVTVAGAARRFAQRARTRVAVR